MSNIDRVIVIYGNNRGYSVSLFSINRQTRFIELSDFKDAFSPSNVAVCSSVADFIRAPDYEVRDEMERGWGHLGEPLIFINNQCGATAAMEKLSPPIYPLLAELAIDKLWDLLAAITDGQFLIAERLGDRVDRKIKRVIDETDLLNHHLAASMVIMMGLINYSSGDFQNIA